MPAFGLRCALALALALAGNLPAQLIPGAASRAEAEGGVDRRLGGRAPAPAGGGV